VTPSARSSPSAGKARVPQAKAGRATTKTAPKTSPKSGPKAPVDPAPSGGLGLVGRILNPAAAAGVPGVERTRPWWGFGDVMLWFVVGRLASLLLLGWVAEKGGYSTDPALVGGRVGEGIGRMGSGQPLSVTRSLVDMPLWLTQGVLLLPLWAAFIGGSVFATVRKGFGPVKDLRIGFRVVDIPIGLGVGFAAQLIVNPLLYRLLFVFTGEQDVSAGARGITDKATSPLLIVLLFVTVGFVAPVAEELFFRGLALRSLIRRFGSIWGLVLSAAFFAVAHTNPLYFVALVPFALVLGWLVLRYDRLGPAIVAHIAYNLVTATVLVFNVETPW
jgi:membrane protease YdiL (CAAX protease family)